jgi:hypothetical protein
VCVEIVKNKTGDYNYITSSSLLFISFSFTRSLANIHHFRLPESVGTIGTQIERECQGIYPLQNVFIRKVKILKKPKFDSFKLMELHGETRTEDTGVKA